MVLTSARLGLALPSAAALVLSFFALSPTPAHANACPTLTYGTTTLSNCSTVLTVNTNLSVSITPDVVNGSTYTNQGFDNSGNVLVGVVNNSGSTIADLYLTGYLGTGNPILNVVPSETLCATNLAGASCSGNLAKSGSTGYEGVVGGTSNITYFTDTGPSSDGTADNFTDVIFTGGLAPGETAYFALASNPWMVEISGVVAEPASILVLAAGLLGFAWMKRRRPAPLPLSAC